MRVSTGLLHQQAIDRLQLQQQSLLKLQTQLATQQKMLSAADAPADWSAALGVDDLLAQTGRYQANAQSAQHRLALSENAIAEGIDVLARVRELTIQGNSASMSPENRAAIARELISLRDQMLAAMNRDDGQGRYLFAGSRDAAPPFSWNGSSANYSGDQQVRAAQIGVVRSVAEGDAGSEVFQRLRTGNGNYAVAASPANTGGIFLRQTSVYDPSLLDGGSYTVSFNGGSYEVRDADDTVIASGAYGEHTVIRARGIELTFSGQPEDGDSFSIAPSSQQDVLALIDKLARLISAPLVTESERAAAQTALQQGFTELEAAESHLSTVRSGIGLRLRAAEEAASMLGAYRIEAESTLSSLRDVDVAEAATRLQQQLLAVQAAQLAYARVQGLSLFDYLR